MEESTVQMYLCHNDAHFPCLCLFMTLRCIISKTSKIEIQFQIVFNPFLRVTFEIFNLSNLHTLE